MAIDFLPSAVAQNRGCRRDVCPELVDCTLRSIGLNEIDRDAQQDHHQDDHGIRCISEDGRDHTCDEEDDDKRIDEEE